MIVSIGNSFTKVAHFDDDVEQQWLYDFLSYEDVSAEYRPSANSDGRVRLYSKKRTRFPTGLLPIVRKGAKKEGVQISEVDTRGPVPFLTDVDLTAPPWNMTGKYDFQLTAIQAWLAGDEYLMPGRGIIWSPTASGKGSIAAAVGRLLPGHTLFAVHRGHLVEDIRGRWDDMAGSQGEPPAGMIGEGTWNVGERFTCATFQSLYSQLGSAKFRSLSNSVTAVIADEAHSVAAKTFHAVLAYLWNARWRLGLSGTPLDRSDKRTMVAVGAIGPICYRVKPKDLQDRGVIAVPTVRIIPVTQGRARGVDWHERYSNQIVTSILRNNAVLAAVQYAYDNGETPGMLFVTALAHGRTLAKQISALGISVQFVSGSANLATRKTACQKLENGRLDFIIATKVFAEGVNIPALATVINAQAGKSIIGTIQQTGRGMRVTATKTSVTVWDFGDKGDQRFHEHAKARVSAYQREGYRCVVDTNTWPENLFSGILTGKT